MLCNKHMLFCCLNWYVIPYVHKVGIILIFCLPFLKLAVFFIYQSRSIYFTFYLTNGAFMKSKHNNSKIRRQMIEVLALSWEPSKYDIKTACKTYHAWSDINHVYLKVFNSDLEFCFTTKVQNKYICNCCPWFDQQSNLLYCKL